MATLADLPDTESPEKNSRVGVFGDYRTLVIRVLSTGGLTVCETHHPIGVGVDDVRFYLTNGQIQMRNLSFEWIPEEQSIIQWGEFCLKNSPNRDDVILGYLNTGSPIELDEGQPLTISDLEWPVIGVPDVQET